MLTLVQVCRVVRNAPFSAKRRPKFISVTISGARFWERSTLSNWFNLYENRYNPLYRMSRRAEALGYARRSPPARAGADYFFKDHKPSAMRGEARLRGLERIISSKTIKNDQNNPPLNADRGRLPGKTGGEPLPNVVHRVAEVHTAGIILQFHRSGLLQPVRARYCIPDDATKRGAYFHEDAV
jgi:hypothetical protein